MQTINFSQKNKFSIKNFKWKKFLEKHFYWFSLFFKIYKKKIPKQVIKKNNRKHFYFKKILSKKIHQNKFTKKK